MAQMIDTLLYSLILALGVSVRSPNDTLAPFDWLVSGGVEYSVSKRVTFSGSIQGAYEREDGQRYRGVDVLQKIQPWPVVELSASYSEREAQDILRWGYSVAGVLDFWRLGLAHVWDHRDPALTAFIGIEHKYVSAAVHYYVEGLESARASVQYPIDLARGLLVLEPRLIATLDRQRRKYYQGKISLKLRFGNGKD